ncbi:LysE family translocator [Actinomadura macrotermitis]|uniref:LysE family translocator n=1 Tax=Actinomadura macrotermitis TaxID=2585200 RepID=A0A7K0C8B2_9ACTN|nr:LysE family translocator [Actinomadura macrotermitis]MQY09034.1 hypothetical protein [Actinomadura macrotermitis]
MVSSAAIAAAAAIALGMVMTPGPNMIYLASRTITQGRRAGLISLGGVATGFAVYVSVTTAGLSAVFAAVPAGYTAIKVGGALYLLWLAVQAVRPGGATAFAPKELPADRPRRLYTMGLVTSLLNPKIAVLYVSLLPQLADPAAGPVAPQILLLGLTQVAVAVTVNGLVVLSAGSIAGFLARRPGWQRAQRYLMGTVLAALAVRIGLDRSRAAFTA